MYYTPPKNKKKLFNQMVVRVFLSIIKQKIPNSRNRIPTIVPEKKVCLLLGTNNISFENTSSSQLFSKLI